METVLRWPFINKADFEAGGGEEGAELKSEEYASSLSSPLDLPFAFLLEGRPGLSSGPFRRARDLEPESTIVSASESDSAAGSGFDAGGVGDLWSSIEVWTAFDSLFELDRETPGRDER